MKWFFASMMSVLINGWILQTATGWGEITKTLPVKSSVPVRLVAKPQKTSPQVSLPPKQVVQPLLKPSVPIKPPVPTLVTVPKKVMPTPPSKKVLTTNTSAKVVTPRPTPVITTPSRIASKPNMPAVVHSPSLSRASTAQNSAMNGASVKNTSHPFHENKLEVNPRPISKIEPIYPRMAKTQGITGYVTVDFTITTSGEVENIRVVRAEPEEVFEETVIQAVSQWLFTPRMVQGVAIAQLARQTIRFSLSDEDN